MIRIALNGMIAVLLAKFIINDLPHAAGLLANPNYGEPATPRQLHYIAVLCQQLKITTPYEEQVRTSGEAGRLIRELETEREHRKRLSGGNPELPGVVVTEVEENITAHMPGIRATAELTRLSPSEAASFGLEANNWLWFNRLINQSGIPRVGTLLLDGVLGYCKEKNYSIVNQVNAYGAVSQQDLESWYIRKGFTPVDYKKYGNTLLKWAPRSLQYGTCYEDAWRYLIKEGEGTLIHGSVQLSAEGPRVNHAWVELPTGWVWEPQTGQYFTIEDFKVLSPTEEHRYTVEEAAIMVARVGNHGPWTGEERNMWL